MGRLHTPVHSCWAKHSADMSLRAPSSQLWQSWHPLSGQPKLKALLGSHIPFSCQEIVGAHHHHCCSHKLSPDLPNLCPSPNTQLP